MKKILLSILLLSSVTLHAQDDLLKLLQSETPARKENVIATFKGDKIINMETNETVRKSNLDFRVNHLFGNVGAQSGGGIHTLYGIDQSADIRIGFHYGVSDKLMLGIAHVKRNENFEGIAKFRLIEQSSDGKIPLAITLFGNAAYSIMDESVFERNVHRLSYCVQAIFARKFSSKFSLALTPTYIHRNFVSADDENNTFSMSGGFRFRFTRSASIITDYSHTFGRENLQTEYYDVAGIGVEVETGGHVFSVMFTNASGIIANDYLLNTQDQWSKGGFKFSFIISRMFRFGKDAVEKKIN